MHTATADRRPSRLARLRLRFDAWTDAEHGRFALWLPVAATAGVALYFSLRAEPQLWLGPARAASAASLAVLARAHRIIRALAAMTLAASLGFSAATMATARAARQIEVPRTALIVSGTVASIDVLPNSRRILLNAPHFADGPAQPRSVRIRLHPGDTTRLASGDTIAVRALLTRPAPPAYPGGWDLQRDAWFSGIGGYGTALNPVVLTQAAPASASWLQNLRESIAQRCTSGLPGAPGAIAATLLTGLGNSIPAADRAAFRDSGLAHLLAIAGLHIGIVMSLAFATSRFILTLSERAALFWPIRGASACAALLTGAGYLLLTGAHVPILRSFAMACLVTLAILAGRRAISLRGLALAMACIVMAAPNEVVGISFQMSFSAVLALITGYAAWQRHLQVLRGESGRGRRLLATVAGLALTSALAGTASAPYGAYHFGQVQLYFVLANMVAVPITAMLVMPAGLVALALMPLHLEILSLTPMGWGIDAVLAVAHRVATLPDATLPVPALPDAAIATFSLGLAWLCLWRTRLRLAGIALIAAGLAAPWLQPPPDILVSADARLIGLRQNGVMLLQKTAGGSAFTEQAWSQYWGLTDTAPLTCPADDCVLQPHPGGPQALLLRKTATPTACRYTMLLSAEPITLRCDPTVPQIDRFSVWRNGATAVWLTANAIRIVTDRDTRGSRPWVLGPPLAGQVPPNTHPAEIEALPAE